MTFPRKYDAASAPAEVIALINRLVPQLLAGDHPALSALREQFDRCQIREVEMTGVGFWAFFDTPLDVSLAIPSNLAGGHAEIVLEGAAHGAGCVLFVADGRLSNFECFTYTDDWPEHSRVISIQNVKPLSPDHDTRTNT